MSIQVTKQEGGFSLRIYGDHAKKLKAISAAEGVKANKLIEEAVQGIIDSMDIPKNYRLKEAAGILEISVRTLHRKIAEHQIEYVQERPHSRIEIPARAIQDYRERHTIKAA